MGFGMVRQAKVVELLLLLRTYHGNGGLEEDGDEAKVVRVMDTTACNSIEYV